jgi:hypothetical protein
MEENSNDAQGKLLTLMESLCTINGAALILTHHFAKGDASAKNAIDRASGGGVFARWGDVMMTFTPHNDESADAMTVSMSLRNFAPVPEFVVKWAHPRWELAGHLDPKDLKTSGPGAPERNSPDDLLRILGDRLLTSSEWEDASGMARPTFYRKRKALLDSGQVQLQSGVFSRT